MVLKAEADTGGVLSKNLFLKISQYSQENICVGSLFNKVEGLTGKRDCNTGVFLWILRNF